LRTLVHNATIVNEGNRFSGALLVEDGRIAEVLRAPYPLPSNLTDTRLVDAQGAFLLPGVIDTHVHFRQPGLTHKADIAHESRAALAGGVTSVMDMPNVTPPTTDLQRWNERMAMGANESRVNYAYYIGATNNADSLPCFDGMPPLKLFMGASTGNMLVDKRDSLVRIFRFAAQHRIPIVAHCEDTPRISNRMTEAQALWGDDPSVEHHPWIRDAEACYRSSSLAVQLAQETGARLHIAHITTERELSLLPPATSSLPQITGEVCVPHLLFSSDDYATLGTRIKCNPAIKDRRDRDALRQAVAEGRLLTIATDHAPHLLSEKQGGCLRAASGMPMIQFSLVAMLSLASKGMCPIERIVDAMCHKPATLFHIQDRGFLRPGFYADFVLVKPEQWTLYPSDILSKCKWSPLEGAAFSWRVIQTYVNGLLAFDHGTLNDTCRGQRLLFSS